MTPSHKTRAVEWSCYQNYLRRAEECFHAAQHSFARQEWNSSSISAIHSTIAACDALCVCFLGKRCAGEDHNNAGDLLRTIRNGEDITRNANRLARILKVKNMAEYEERLVFKTEAEKILQDCERLLHFARQELSAKKN
jgi:uncharacterized protein (UPF0332 family)